MKLIANLPLIAALFASSLVFAQSGNMNMKDMDMKKCMGMKDMKGVDMKGMDAQKCQEMMKKMDEKRPANEVMTHKADALVKVVDPVSGKVTLAHGAVKSLGWPAMTMGFSVKDKTLLEKLVAGNKVHVEFQKQGGEYVITAVK